jgi:Tol biopolymer transport system component
MTRAGMILGTAAYMSPEQARGKVVDRRTDIWAFGVVLYEIVTGHRLFEGEDLTETLAKVMRDRPDLSDVPLKVRRLLERCLEKDPKKRLRDIGDMELLLVATEAPIAATAPSPPRLQWIVAGIMTAIAAVALWAPWRAPATAPQVQRFEIPPPDQSGFNNALQLSPDGRHLMFTSSGEGRAIWIRSLDTLQARKIAPWTQPPAPFWSPDSRFLAFQQDGKLKKVDIAGGPPVPLSDAPQNFGGGAWNADGVIVFGDRGGPLMQVPSAGGVPVALTKLDEKRGDGAHLFPCFLPDKKHFVYYRRSNNKEFSGIYIGAVGVPPEQQDSKLLIATQNSAVYTPSPDPRERTRGLGFLLFLREQTLMAQPFDASALELKGEPAPIAQQVATTNYGFGRFTASGSGALAFFTVAAGAPTKLTWFDRQGKNLGTVGQPGRYGTLAIAPDGSRVAAEKYDGTTSDLWLIDSAPDGKYDRFTFDPGRETSPVWSPDGSQIIFASDRGSGVLNFFKKPTNLAGKDEELYQSNGNKVTMDWSRDGKTLSFCSFASSKAAVWTLNLSDRKAALFFKTPSWDIAGHFSPDGHWLTYASDVTGRPEVYVRPFPANEAGGQQMISVAGGVLPLWRRDGKELYYLAASRVMAVEVTPGVATLKFGQPKPLFAFGSPAPSNAYSWDVTADGSRFLINIAGTETATSPPLTLVLNWTAGLK